MFGTAVRIIDLEITEPASQEKVREYYEGGRLTWNIIKANGDVERDQYDELLAFLYQPHKGTRMLCLTGEPGSGKSTLAWRLAVDTAYRKCIPLLQCRDNRTAEVWWDIESVAEQYGIHFIVLIDDVFADENVVRTLGNLSLFST